MIINTTETVLPHLNLLKVLVPLRHGAKDLVPHPLAHVGEDLYKTVDVNSLSDAATAVRVRLHGRAPIVLIDTRQRCHQDVAKVGKLTCRGADTREEVRAISSVNIPVQVANDLLDLKGQVRR